MVQDERTLYTGASAVLSLRGGGAGPRAGASMGELGLVRDGAVVVSHGKISWVGTATDVPEDIERGARVVRCDGQTIMPAMVDCHTHLVWGGNRRDELEMRLAGADYEEIFAAGGGILSSVRQTRAVSEDDLYSQSLRRVRRMQRAGTTTFEIKSGYGLDLATELKQLRVVKRLREGGVRARATCLAAHAIPAELRGSAGGRATFVDLVCDEILPAVVAENLATACDVFCDRGAFTPEESRRILREAKRLGLELRVHANEFGHTGGAQVAAEFGARSADHLLHLSPDERRHLRDAGVVATLLPGTSLVLGKPYADGRALVEAGVPIAVATDCNPGSCALESLSAVMGLACYGNRLSPAEALCAVTHNAAASMGLDAQVGSLAEGHDADFLLLDTDDYRDLVYHAGSPLISAVVSRGELVAGSV